MKTAQFQEMSINVWAAVKIFRQEEIIYSKTIY